MARIEVCIAEIMKDPFEYDSCAPGGQSGAAMSMAHIGRAHEKDENTLGILFVDGVPRKLVVEGEVYDVRRCK